MYSLQNPPELNEHKPTYPVTTRAVMDDRQYAGIMEELRVISNRVKKEVGHIHLGPDSSTTHSNLTQKIQPKSLTARLIERWVAETSHHIAC